MQYRITVELPRLFNDDEELEPAYIDFDCEDGDALTITALLIDGICYRYGESFQPVMKTLGGEKRIRKLANKLAKKEFERLSFERPSRFSEQDVINRKVTKLVGGAS